MMLESGTDQSQKRKLPICTTKVTVGRLFLLSELIWQDIGLWMKDLAMLRLIQLDLIMLSFIMK